MAALDGDAMTIPEDLWLERQEMEVPSTKREASGAGLGWFVPGKQ